MAQNKTSYIPYRESKLTRFLQDSIGKNSQTWLIATVSPTLKTFDETLNTLKFADQAIKIKVKASNNTIEIKESEKIDELQKEINYLKELLNLKRSGNTDDVHRQLYMLKKENSKLRKIAASSSVLPKNLFTNAPSYTSVVSTARNPLNTFEGLDSADNIRDFKSPTLLDSGREIKVNNRYNGYINGKKIESTVQAVDNIESPFIKNTKTKTTNISSNVPGRLSREGRSSTDLQFAGAKILAGTYKNTAIATSLSKEDVIPVRIRSHKRTGKHFYGILILRMIFAFKGYLNPLILDIQNGSKAHSLTQQEAIRNVLKGNF